MNHQFPRFAKPRGTAGRLAITCFCAVWRFFDRNQILGDFIGMAAIVTILCVSLFFAAAYP